MKSTGTVTAISILIFALAVLLTIGFSRVQGVSLSAHGWFALILGTIVTLALSGGLFWLTFHSARSGHDEEVGFED